MPKTATRAGAGKRYPLNMRTTKETRDRLEQAASESGRSLAQEVEARLSESFNRADTFTAAFGGPDMQRLAFLMATAFESAGRAGSGGKPTAKWINNKDAYSAGVRGVMEALLIGLPNATRDDIVRQFEGIKIRILTRWANEDQDNE